MNSAEAIAQPAVTTTVAHCTTRSVSVEPVSIEPVSVEPVTVPVTVPTTLTTRSVAKCPLSPPIPKERNLVLEERNLVLAVPSRLRQVMKCTQHAASARNLAHMTGAELSTVQTSSQKMPKMEWHFVSPKMETIAKWGKAVDGIARGTRTKLPTFNCKRS